MNESDLRVKRTRQKVKEAFLALLTEQPYSEITVLQIVGRAEISHKTFYRHYSDKRALVMAMLSDIVDELLTRRATVASLKAAESNAFFLLQVVDKHSDFINAVREAVTLPELASQLQPVGVAEVEQIYALHPKASNKGIQTAVSPPLPLMGYHFMATTLQLIDWWVQNDKPYTISQMTQYINYIVIRPLSGK